MQKARFFLTGWMATLAFAFLMTPLALAAEVLDPFCNTQEVQSLPVEERPSVCRDNQSTASSDSILFGPDGLLTKTVNIIAIVVAVSAVIVIILAAIKMITSNGDANKVSQARQSIIFASVGLLIAGASKLIVEVILSKIG